MTQRQRQSKTLPPTASIGGLWSKAEPELGIGTGIDYYNAELAHQRIPATPRLSAMQVKDLSLAQQVLGHAVATPAGAGFMEYVNAMALGIPEVIASRSFKIGRRDHSTAASVGQALGFAASLRNPAAILGRGAAASTARVAPQVTKPLLTTYNVTRAPLFAQVQRAGTLTEGAGLCGAKNGAARL